MNLEARFILLELQLMQTNKKLEKLADTMEWLRVKLNEEYAKALLAEYAKDKDGTT